MNNSQQDDCDQCRGGLGEIVVTIGPWIFCCEKCYEKWKKDR